MTQCLTRATRLLIATTILFTSFSVSAYEILPHNVHKLINKDPIHEAMTVSSYLCSRVNNKIVDGIITCKEKYRQVSGIWSHYLAGNSLGDKEKKLVGDLIEGVRWPDDPLRNLTKLKSTPKWGQVFASCEKLIFPKYGSCSNRLCQSHFGNLQIWHGMKPSRPWCDGQSDFGCDIPSENSGVRNEIIKWAEFLAGVATGKISLDSALTDNAGHLFDGACDKVYSSSMKVRDLFRTDCSSKSNAAQITICNTNNITDEKVRILAVGALLHLVQDSYSRSHVFREGGDQGCPAATVSCGNPVYYYDYSMQDSNKHGVSDQWPLWAENCNSKSVDPIAIGATIILLAENKNQKKIMSLLKNRVFPLTDDISQQKNENTCYE